MLHLIYTRNNYDMDSVGGHFESHITLIRNVPYSHLSRLLINKNDPELLNIMNIFMKFCVFSSDFDFHDVKSELNKYKIRIKSEKSQKKIRIISNESPD